MSATEDNFISGQLSKTFANLIMVCRCCVCNANEDLSYFEECMHVVCMNCVEGSPDDNCPDCEIPGVAVSVSQQSLTILACNIAMKLSTDLEGPQAAVPFFSPNVFPIKKDSKGETVLHRECRRGDLDIVKNCLERGADPNEQDFAGWTPLHETVVLGNLQAAELLVEYGALVNIPAHSRSYETPLISALSRGKIQMVEFFVKHGADLNCLTDEGFTVFDFCKDNNFEMFRALCLTPRNTTNYSVFTIPKPRIAFLQKNDDLTDVASETDILTVLPLSVLSEPAGEVNYLLMDSIEPNNIYVQFAILRGALVVDAKWCSEYIKRDGKINPMDYIIKAPGFYFDKSALNMFNKRPKLFSELNFHFSVKILAVVVNNFKYTNKDLVELVVAGGGKILKRCPTKREGAVVKYPYHTDKNSNTATINTYIIYDAPAEALKQRYGEGIRVRSMKWFITCINTFTIIPDSI